MKNEHRTFLILCIFVTILVFGGIIAIKGVREKEREQRSIKQTEVYLCASIYAMHTFLSIDTIANKYRVVSIVPASYAETDPTFLLVIERK